MLCSIGIKNEVRMEIVPMLFLRISSHLGVLNVRSLLMCVIYSFRKPIEVFRTYFCNRQLCFIVVIHFSR